MDRIDVVGVVCKARIGVPDNERQFPQDVYVDVGYEFDFRDAVESDDFSKTVDYEEIVAVVRATASSRRWSLLETLADHLCTTVLAMARIRKVEVRVRKYPVSLRGSAAFVSATVRREK